MSPSEVIIEVHIMPEDAAFGALFSFPFQDLFLVFQGGETSSPPTSSLFVTAGLAVLPLFSSLFSPGHGTLGAVRESWKGATRSSRCAPRPVGFPYIQWL